MEQLEQAIEQQRLVTAIFDNMGDYVNNRCLGMARLFSMSVKERNVVINVEVGKVKIKFVSNQSYTTNKEYYDSLIEHKIALFINLPDILKEFSNKLCSYLEEEMKESITIVNDFIFRNSL